MLRTCSNHRGVVSETANIGGIEVTTHKQYSVASALAAAPPEACNEMVRHECTESRLSAPPTIVQSVRDILTTPVAPGHAPRLRQRAVLPHRPAPASGHLPAPDGCRRQRRHFINWESRITITWVDVLAAWMALTVELCLAAWTAARRVPEQRAPLLPFLQEPLPVSIITLSQLPQPDADRGAGFRGHPAERKAYFHRPLPSGPASGHRRHSGTRNPSQSPLLQENAYRELILRSRINDAAVANMLAWAGSDLDNLVANSWAAASPSNRVMRHRHPAGARNQGRSRR